jgi:hypothetical protein
MFVRIQQDMTFVLTENRDKTVSQGFNHGQCGATSVYRAFRAAAQINPTRYHQLSGTVWFEFKVVRQDARVLYFKEGFDPGFFSPRPYYVSTALCAEDKTEGANKDGFPRAGLTGQDVETFLKFNLDLVDNGKIIYS